jgi:hypothetical protein
MWTELVFCLVVIGFFAGGKLVLRNASFLEQKLTPWQSVGGCSSPNEPRFYSAGEANWIERNAGGMLEFQGMLEVEACEHATRRSLLLSCEFSPTWKTAVNAEIPLHTRAGILHDTNQDWPWHQAGAGDMTLQIGTYLGMTGNYTILDRMCLPYGRL